MEDTAKRVLSTALVILALFLGVNFVLRSAHENKILREVITRLEADTRSAEVLVSGVNYNDKTGKVYTTIKFLEYDTDGVALDPRYFTFTGNIIQFQSLVIRFKDIYVRGGDRLRGKSACLFWKVFMLDGANTQEYQITPAYAVPEGYQIAAEKDPFEEKLWKRFWKYALDSKESEKMGIKNAQIEAPGTMFIPGMLYVIKIEHDGGMRIDSFPLPSILQGEYIPKVSQ